MCYKYSLKSRLRIKCDTVLIALLRSSTKVDVIFKERFQLKPTSTARVNSTTSAACISLHSWAFAPKLPNFAVDLILRYHKIHYPFTHPTTHPSIYLLFTFRYFIGSLQESLVVSQYFLVQLDQILHITTNRRGFLFLRNKILRF